MTNLHKIRARIRSVNSTQQITRTMKMIAVSKLRKTQTSLAGVRLFADKSQAVLNALLAGDASFEHPVSHAPAARRPRVLRGLLGQPRAVRSV